MKKLDEPAITLLRRAAAGKLPVDAGLCAMMSQHIRHVHTQGSYDAALQLAQAYQLFLDNDDLEIMRDTLTSLLPPGYQAPEPPT